MHLDSNNWYLGVILKLIVDEIARGAGVYPAVDFELLMMYQSPPRSCSAQATARVGLTCGLM